MNTIVLSKTQLFRYVWSLVGLIFMVLSVRVYVNNYLTIEQSISQTQQEIIRTQEETEFIRNFQLPYLQSDLAVRNLLHRQQMVQEDGKIVLFTYFQEVSVNEQQSSELIIERSGWTNFIIDRWNNSLR